MYQRKNKTSHGPTSQSAAGVHEASRHASTGLGNAEMQRRIHSVQDGSDFASRPSTHHLGYKTSGWGTNRGDPEYTRGSVFDAAGKWNANTILSNLTQLDADSETLVDGKRCAAVAALAIHIMGGPSAVAKVAQDVLAQMNSQLNVRGRAQMKLDIQVALKTLRPTIEQLPQALMDKTATYEQLHRLADCIKLVVDKNIDSGTSGGEYKKMMKLGKSESQFINRVHSGMAAADKLVAQLKESGTEGSYMLSIGTREEKTDVTNHAITLGLDASGRAYLYDPWPKVGTQMLMWDSDRDKIRPYFENKAGKERRWRILVRIKDAQSSQNPKVSAE